MTRQAGWYWTPERVVAAMQVFAEVYGRPPRYNDFNPSKAMREEYERFHADGCWPSGATVVRHWGTWNYAIEAAGYAPVPQGQIRGGRKRMVERCAQGHPYTPENTAYRASNGARICKTCSTNWRRAAYNKHHKGPGSRKSRGMPQSDPKKAPA